MCCGQAPVVLISMYASHRNSSGLRSPFTTFGSCKSTLVNRSLRIRYLFRPWRRTPLLTLKPEKGHMDGLRNSSMVRASVASDTAPSATAGATLPRRPLPLLLPPKGLVLLPKLLLLLRPLPKLLLPKPLLLLRPPPPPPPPPKESWEKRQEEPLRHVPCAKNLHGVRLRPAIEQLLGANGLSGGTQPRKLRIVTIHTKMYRILRIRRFFLKPDYVFMRKGVSDMTGLR